MMKRVDPYNLEPGMMLAKPIMVGNSTLLDQGIILTDQYIENIRRRDIQSVYIESDHKYKPDLFVLPSRMIQTPVAEVLFSEPPVHSSRISDGFPDDSTMDSLFTSTAYTPGPSSTPLSDSDLETAYRQSLDAFAQVVGLLRSNRRIDEQVVESVVHCIMVHAERNPVQAVEMLANCSLNNYVLSHSLNVTYLAVMLGKKLGFEEKRVMLLGISALLHDIGMLKMDRPCWNKEGALTDLERLDVEKHTIFGIDTIAACTRFPKEVAYVSYLHHERMDGSGYPKAKKGNLITEFAQIVSLCDVFAAMISDRVYRQSIPFMKSLDYIYTRSNGYFNRKYVDSLVRYLDESVKPGIYSDVMELSRQYSEQFRISIIDSSPDVKTKILKNTLERHFFTVNTSDPSGFDDPSLIILNLKNVSDTQTYKRVISDQSVSKVPVVVLSDQEQLPISPDQRTHILSGGTLSYNIIDIIEKVRNLLSRN